MNPRIRELAEQAGITTNLDTDFFEKDPNKWVDYYSEKFAELIVRECAGIAKQTDTHDGDDYKSGRVWAGIDILKHFNVGVES